MILFAHQNRFVEIATTRPRFAFFAACGTGKTIASLAICDQIRLKTLVLAPKSVMGNAWGRDAENFPNLKTQVIWSANARERGNMIRGPWDIGITNYDTFRRNLGDFLATGVRRLIVDESSKIRNPDAAITKAVWQFADRMESVYLLSGTPAPNNVTEYFAQLRALGRQVAGVSYWSFASRYAIPVREKVRARGKIQDVVTGFKQTPEQAERLGALLKQHAWSLRKEDCLDLPPQSDVVLTLQLDDEAGAYEAAKDELRLAVASENTRINPEARLIKLRQITGGAVRDTAGDVHRVGSTKLNALSDFFESLGPEPCVAWAEFTHEIDMIRELCESRGESCEIIDGRSSWDSANIAARFQDGKTMRLICHPQAAGHGITLTRASYAVYYSLSFSYEQYAQSRDRIHRAGQTKPCTYAHLIAANTVDEGCLRVVRRKGTVSDAFREILGEKGRLPVAT